MLPAYMSQQESATSWWNRGLQGTSNDEGNGFPRMMGEYRCMGGNFARERHGYETAHRLWLQQLLVPVAWRGTWGHLRRLHCKKAGLTLDILVSHCVLGGVWAMAKLSFVWRFRLVSVSSTQPFHRPISSPILVIFVLWTKTLQCP
jgi:hypothetical protein